MKAKNPEDFGEITVFGVDIGKDTFHLFGFDLTGSMLFVRRLSGWC